MSRSDRDPQDPRDPNTPFDADDEPSLFDLPLGPPSRERAEKPPGRLEVPIPPPRTQAPRPEPVPRPAPATRARAAAAPRAEPGAPSERSERSTAASDAVPLRSRIAAGIADLVVHAALATVAVAGSALLVVRPQPSQAAPLALFVLSFSFLYTVIPLAFWGQTLGMVWAGLVAQNHDGDPLTFDQSARRWIGQLLTLLTAGLPLLATGSGRSVTDLVSGSETQRTD
jgi:uncharacterized RDD family membrane protein YckC